MIFDDEQVLHSDVKASQLQQSMLLSTLMLQDAVLCAGRISLKVINRYVQATGGLAPFGALIALFILQEGARIAATVWLSVWTSSNDSSGIRKALILLTRRHCKLAPTGCHMSYDCVRSDAPML